MYEPKLFSPIQPPLQHLCGSAIEQRFNVKAFVYPFTAAEASRSSGHAEVLGQGGRSVEGLADEAGMDHRLPVISRT